MSGAACNSIEVFLRKIVNTKCETQQLGIERYSSMYHTRIESVNLKVNR